MNALEFLAIAAEARRKKPAIDFSSIPIHLDSLLPLTRIDEETGERKRVLYCKTDNEFHVHPDRWEEFVLWVSQPDIADHPDVRAIFEDEDD